jgi:hypothetical protein
MRGIMGRRQEDKVSTTCVRLEWNRWVHLVGRWCRNVASTRALKPHTVEGVTRQIRMVMPCQTSIFFDFKMNT